MTSILDTLKGFLPDKEKGKESHDFGDPDSRLDRLGPTVSKTIGEKAEETNTKEQLRSLERKRNRESRFKRLAEDLKQNGDGSMENETVESVQARKLLQADKRGNRLGSIFAYKQTADREGNIVEEPLDHERIDEGDTILIDFGENASVSRRVGAGDLLPTKIRVVKIIDTQGVERIGTRMSSGAKLGYYDAEGKYIPIFNGYKIYIPKASELSSEEYAKLGEKESIISDQELLKKNEESELKEKQRYIDLMITHEKAEKISDILTELFGRVGPTSNYKEKLLKTLSLAEQLKSGESGYAKEDLDLVTQRLKATLEIIGDNDFGFDWDRYKNEIASIESGRSYFSRNDEAGKVRGVSSENFAFGKYQFTTATLRGYGVDLGNPIVEEKVQEFLGDHAKQEAIMDRYMLACIQGHILRNQSIMESISKKEHTMPYYLAITHIGGPGKLENPGGKDWLGTSVVKYAERVEKACAAV